jgi:hypothetical protein
LHSLARIGGFKELHRTFVQFLPLSGIHRSDGTRWSRFLYSRCCFLASHGQGKRNQREH